MTELLCSRDLALRLGAIAPETIQHHRYLKRQGSHLLIRDIDTENPLFWMWKLERHEMVAERSSR